MATIEAIPILMVFMVLVSYALGSFGAIHTAILHSIAARTYAYETFRHRTDLTYLRDIQTAQIFSYRAAGCRVHGIGSPEGMAVQQTFYATERNIAKGWTGPDTIGRTNDVHNTQVFTVQDNKRATVGVNPIWVMVQYGICLNSNCGPS